MDDWHGLFLLLALALFWYLAMGAREQVLDLVRRTCAELEVHWLDESVSLVSLKPRRDGSGRWRVCRVYGFRYLDAHSRIREGEVVRMGARLHVLLPDPAGADGSSMVFELPQAKEGVPCASCSGGKRYPG
ncbi:MAG: DUF3301 domain-containing protein [Magnetococcales bacterium]|nr:DUF3301 domain-containing protein [Magnetococcales bacterium]